MSNKFLTFSLIVIFSILASCQCGSVDKESKILRYDRLSIQSAVNNVSGDIYYVDYLKITNYKKGSKTVKNFYDIAKRYIDTTIADKKIMSVIFIGEEPCSQLPAPRSESETSDSQIIKFFFSYDTGAALLYNISFNKDGQLIFLMADDKFEKSIIDSLLLSKEKIDNE